MKITIFVIISIFSLIVPTICHRLNSQLFEESIIHNENYVADTPIEGPQEQDDHSQGINNRQRDDTTISYVKASIPIRIFQCMQRLSILKCMKIFILQRMERTPMYLNSGNVTADFLDQILANNDQEGNGGDDIFDRFYLQMSETEINERLLKSFQRFFKDREIKLHFIPGMVVKVVPSQENAINLSLKRASTWVEDYARRRNRPGELLLQLGVPAVMMPAILMGTVLPFILPALKFATIFSGIINHAALMSALIYTAKHAALGPDATKHIYFNPGYHRRSLKSL